MNIRTLSILLGMMALVSTAGAQERRTIGLGVKLNTLTLLAPEDAETALLPIGPTAFSVPINLTRNFRIEPEFGVWSSSSTLASTFQPGPSADQTITDLSAGTGLLYVQPVDDSFNAYAGVHAGIVHSHLTITQGGFTGTSSETDFFVGPCGGGEYFFSPHFSAGVEIQFNYLDFGDPETTGLSQTPTTTKQSGLTTNALLLCRVYL